MTEQKGMHLGARWLRCDFQCHTPRDPSWKGPESLKGGTVELENAREEWAKNFVAQCLAAKVSAIAVTDHHDAIFAGYVTKCAKSHGLVVFPGVEVTCKDNAQCLVLFNPNATENLLQQFLGKLSGVAKSPRDEAKAAKTENCDLTVEELFAAVSGDKLLKNDCLLLPHFSDGDAHKHLNQEGHHKRFANIDCDGVYAEKAYVDLQDGTLKKIRGEIPEWGNRRRALLITGDNKTSDGKRLGAFPCWIKLGEPTVEGVRQALLADEARISYTAPLEPSERISELRVKSSLTGKSDFVVRFNSGFNALIGGRGSGKSAILEYLRFGLGRTESDLRSVDDPIEDFVRSREANLIEETLIDGFVEVTIEREGVIETWHRDLARRDTITITDKKSGKQTEVSIEAAQLRFRARAFYQKELSTTMTDRQTAADQITGIAAAEALDKRREIDDKIARQKRALQTSFRKNVAVWELERDLSTIRFRIGDLASRIAAISKRLKLEGATEADLDIIQLEPLYSRAETYQGQVNLARINDYKRAEALKNILKVSISEFDGVSAFGEMAALDTAVKKAREHVQVQTDAILKSIDDVGAAYAESLSAYEGRKSEFKIKLEAANKNQKAHKTLLDDSKRLNDELIALQRQEAEMAAKNAESGPVQIEFESAQNDLSQYVKDRLDVLINAADAVGDKSSKLLKARPKRDPESPELVRALVQLMEGARIVDCEVRCREWLKQLHKAQSGSDFFWLGLARQTLELYKKKIMLGNPVEPGEDVLSVLKAFLLGGSITSEGSIKKIFSNLNDETVGAILAAVPADFIVMTYNDGGRDVSFEKASPGQQASALLELLLKQSAGTLIIDQPEDDLDNKVIMNIVGLIGSSKSNRQLIFSTHNANVVVNGDADKIVALESGTSKQTDDDAARVEIECDGSIETESIKESITRTMEGGKEAFDLRRRKYSFGLR